MHFVSLIIALSSLLAVNATPIPQDKYVAPLTTSITARAPENSLDTSHYDLGGGHLSNVLLGRKVVSRRKPNNTPKPQNRPKAPNTSTAKNTPTAPDTPTLQGPPKVQSPQTPQSQNGMVNGLLTGLEVPASGVSIAVDAQTLAQNSGGIQDIPIIAQNEAGVEVRLFLSF
jgi:hypothetical protein